jgi:cell division protein FtsW
MGRKLAFDRTLFVAVIAMTLFGILMVYSASAIWALENKGSSYHYLHRQVAWTLLGLGVMIAAMVVDYRHYGRPAVVYGLLGGSAVLLLWALASPAVNGAHRWIWLGPLTFQPSELAKLAIVVLLAHQLARRRDRIHDLSQSVGPCLVLIGPVMVLVLIQPDLGAAAMMAVLFGVLLFVAGLRVRVLLAGALAGALALGVLIASEEYRWKRLETYLDPESDPTGAGFQLHQSLLAISSGGLSGRSLGESRQKMLYLPLPHTDFIYAVIGEELGMAGCLGVVAGFLVVLWRGLRAAVLIHDPFGAYLGVGLTVFLVGQAMINIGVVLGMLPTKGLPLPFISYGGSSLVVSLAAAGVLLNLSQYSN